MQAYLKMLRHVLDNGAEKDDRTGTGTLSVFGYQARFDLACGFPLLTTKRIHFKSIVHELLWFLSGSANVKYLQDNGVTIWDEWARPDGELGPVYGAQWRSWRCRDGSTIDQLGDVVERLKRNPDDRRLIVTAWNPEDVPAAALPPCHVLFQFYARKASAADRLLADYMQNPIPIGADRVLSCLVYQRSCDTFLGVPFNIASYALLTHLIAASVDMLPGELIWTGGDVHLYMNHLEQARLQMERTPRPLPRVIVTPRAQLDYVYDDIALLNYDPHPSIKASVAV